MPRILMTGYRFSGTQVKNAVLPPHVIPSWSSKKTITTALLVFSQLMPILGSKMTRSEVQCAVLHQIEKFNLDRTTPPEESIGAGN